MAPIRTGCGDYVCNSVTEGLQAPCIARGVGRGGSRWIIRGAGGVLLLAARPVVRALARRHCADCAGLLAFHGDDRRCAKSAAAFGLCPHLGFWFRLRVAGGIAADVLLAGREAGAGEATAHPAGVYRTKASDHEGVGSDALGAARVATGAGSAARSLASLCLRRRLCR